MLAAAVAVSLPASATAGQRSGQSRLTHLTAIGAPARAGRLVLLRETHNPDGSVVAVWRGRKGGRLYYLGPPHARISLHETVVRTRRGKRLRETTVQARVPGGRSGWTARVAPRAGGMRNGAATAALCAADCRPGSPARSPGRPGRRRRPAIAAVTGWTAPA
jgi:hypothetical protein